MRLKSPLIVAPAGITETADRIARCEEHGAGAVVMKTLTELEIMRSSPTPRFRLLKKAKGLKHFILYSCEQASPFNAREYAGEIEKSRRLTRIPVIASIDCVSEESWVETARMMADAGANALEVNLACPHGEHMSSVSRIEDRIVQVTGRVASAVKIPIAIKLPPQLTDPLAVARRVEEAGAKGVIIFNRLPGLDIDIERQRPIMHGGFAGHGGYWSIHYPLRWVAELSPVLRIDIGASGGVGSGGDAIKYLLAGAAAVQVCTAIIVNGYSVIERMNTEIVGYLRKHGFGSVGELQGLVCDRVVGLKEFDRRQSVTAVIDEEQCNGCGVCRRICFYGAIIPAGAGFAVTEACVGCGLCRELCDRGAISMAPLAVDPSDLPSGS
jgi:dihydroorotate dehydrogenase (fumarate)